MDPLKAQEQLLGRVERPSRYLGSEVNRVTKDWSKVKLTMALAFPDLYDIGTCHFGIQILYHILNRHEDIAAERVFAPAADMMDLLAPGQGGPGLRSLESGRPLGAFDIVGFSLLYELNFTNVLAMLALSGIALRAADRGPNAPLVIAGGPCTVNPEPMAAFFDAMVIGDGEEVIVAMAGAAMAWKAQGSGNKDVLLDEWARIQGVYIPSRLAPGTCVRRAIVADLETAAFPTAPVVPFGRPVHDRLRIELARGCSRGCRFCQAGMIYRPVRERSAQTVADLTCKALAATGYEDISLLSLSTGDYTCLTGLLGTLMEHLAKDRVAVSLPSLRAASLTPALMAQIKKVRKTGFTIAPEAGSQRLRDVINKNITGEDIETAVVEATRMGWKVIKLYFMIGLPFETETDVAAIAELVEDLRRLTKRRIQLNVSVAAFIPKPHTPFQWAGQLAPDQAMDRLAYLQRRLRYKDVQFKWQNPKISLLEGVFARGDRALGPLLETARGLGCCFDGWTDRFDSNRWQQAMETTGIDPAAYTGQRLDLNAALAWDHIDIGVTKAFLQEQWQRAAAAQTTPDCRHGDCQGCGLCDFDAIQPRLAPQGPIVIDSPPPAVPGDQDLDIFFSKTGLARYLSHLEVMKVFERALRRAGLSLAFSKGFHPKPRMVFADALPVGMASCREKLTIGLATAADPVQVMQRLNAGLPEGLTVTACLPAAAARQAKGPTLYRIEADDGVFDQKAIDSFRQQPSWPIAKGASRRVDLKAAVTQLVLTGPATVQMGLQPVEGIVLRPADVLRAVWGWDEAALDRATIIKEGESPCTKSC